MASGMTLYWILVSAGILLSGILFVCLSRRRGFSAALSAGGWILGLALALFCAKAVYVCFYFPALSQYGAAKWIRFLPREFSFTAGGIGLCLGPVLLGLKQRKTLPALLDCLAVPGCLLAAFLRFAEIELGQTALADVRAMGLPDITDGSLLARWPFAAQDAWGDWYLAVSTVAAAAALLIGLGSFLRLRHFSRYPAGMIFRRCAFLLCAVRFFLELTRMECLIFYFVHLDQALCALVILALFIFACMEIKKAGKPFPVLSLLLFLLCMALNGVTQYAMDKPWKFQALFSESGFRWLNDNLSWFSFSLLLLTTVCMTFLYLRLLRRAKAAV